MIMLTKIWFWCPAPIGREQKKVPFPLDLELWIVVSYHVCSAKVASALNNRVIFSALHLRSPPIFQLCCFAYDENFRITDSSSVCVTNVVQCFALTLFFILTVVVKFFTQILKII